MLACRPLTERHVRADLRFLPVRGLERTSQLGLVWRTNRTNPALAALTEHLNHAIQRAMTEMTASTP